MPLSVCSLQLHVLFNKFILETRAFLWLYKYPVQEFFTNFNSSKRFDTLGYSRSVNFTIQLARSLARLFTHGAPTEIDI